MAAVVWVITGIAIWHFTIFVPDRFWQGIVGAFIGSVTGAVVLGALVQLIAGRGLGTTDAGTVLIVIPGSVIGLAIVYAIGVRAEREAEETA